MKTIINGKTYDTKTARYIGNVKFCHDANDFMYYDADLYVVPTTRDYFLCGMNHTTNCKFDIVPLSKEQAVEAI